MRLLSIVVLASLLTTTFAILPTASAEPGYECDEQNHVNGAVRVTLRRDCSFEIVAFEEIICVGGWGGSVEQDVGDHTVRAYYCDGGLVDRVRDLIAPPTLSTAAPCKDSTQNTGVATVYMHSDCSTQVDLKLYDCVWNCEWKTLVDTPLLVVRVYQESYGTADAAPSCNGFWYYEETVGPVTVWTDGSTRCTGFDIDRVESSGKDIYVPEFMSCLWKGSYKPVVATPVATVWVYTCDSPDA